LLAHPFHVLVDDSPANVVAFRNRSGQAIGFKQPWNDFGSDWQQVLEELRGMVICV
jgi:hypothetical protein